MGASIRFYAELNDFLPEHLRQIEFMQRVQGSTSIKDPIEALGVPHTEIDLILANGEPVNFSCRLREGDRISIFPVCESIDISEHVRLQPTPLRDMRFVLDTHLGRLAGYLRMLGFDTLYKNKFNDEELARISSEEHRILLTKDRGLLKRNMETHGHCVRGTHPREKLIEVLRPFDLFKLIQPFRRCIRCNGLFVPVPRAEVVGELLQRCAKPIRNLSAAKVVVRSIGRAHTLSARSAS